jgi:membrane-bound inhibitor of C-type lysozyme
MIGKPLRPALLLAAALLICACKSPSSNPEQAWGQPTSTRQRVYVNEERQPLQVVFKTYAGTHTVSLPDGKRLDLPNQTVTVPLPDGSRATLLRTISASGERFTNPSETIVFWEARSRASLWKDEKLLFNGTTKP